MLDDDEVVLDIHMDVCEGVDVIDDETDETFAMLDAEPPDADDDEVVLERTQHLYDDDEGDVV